MEKFGTDSRNSGGPILSLFLLRPWTPVDKITAGRGGGGGLGVRVWDKREGDTDRKTENKKT